MVNSRSMGRYGEISPIILTHRGRVTHICVGYLTIISSDNGLADGRLYTVIWTNAWILLIWRLETNYSEILNAIQTFFTEESTFKNVVCVTLSNSSWSQCVNTFRPEQMTNILLVTFSNILYDWKFCILILYDQILSRSNWQWCQH